MHFCPGMIATHAESINPLLPAHITRGLKKNFCEKLHNVIIKHPVYAFLVKIIPINSYDLLLLATARRSVKFGLFFFSLRKLRIPFVIKHTHTQNYLFVILWQLFNPYTKNLNHELGA